MLEKLYLYLKLKPLAYLSRFRRWVMGSHSTAVLVESWNGDLLVPITDFFVGRRLTRHGSFDREMIEELSRLLGPDSDVLVVGAHVGALLVPLARRGRSAIGVEANPETFRLLERNVLLNGLKNVELLNLAASDREGTVELLANTTNTGGSKVKPAGHKRLEFYYDDPETVEVKSERLDDLLGERSFDLVVLDVEGSEYRALRGMPEILAKVGHLVVEVAPNHIDNVAGVTREEFVSAIPERFTRASLVGSDRSLNRSELRGLLDEIWENDYYGSPNLRFEAAAAPGSPDEE